MTSDDRRIQILNAARQLFSNQGYHKTTTRDIAHAIGVSDTLLYRYFESKQAVLQAILEQSIKNFATMEKQQQAHPMSALEKLNHLGHAFYRRMMSELDVIVILISEHQLLADDQRFIRFIDGAARGFGAELEQRAQEGEIRKDINGYLVARQFMGSIVAFIILQEILDLQRIHPLEADHYIETLAQNTFVGIAKNA